MTSFRGDGIAEMIARSRFSGTRGGSGGDSGAEGGERERGRGSAERSPETTRESRTGGPEGTFSWRQAPHSHYYSSPSRCRKTFISHSDFPLMMMIASTEAPTPPTPDPRLAAPPELISCHFPPPKLLGRPLPDAGGRGLEFLPVSPAQFPPC